MEWYCYSPHFNFGDGQKEKRKRNLLDTCFTDPADAAAAVALCKPPTFCYFLTNTLIYLTLLH